MCRLILQCQIFLVLCVSLCVLLMWVFPMCRNAIFAITCTYDCIFISSRTPQEKHIFWIHFAQAKENVHSFVVFRRARIKDNHWIIVRCVFKCEYHCVFSLVKCAGDCGLFNHIEKFSLVNDVDGNWHGAKCQMPNVPHAHAPVKPLCGYIIFSTSIII